MRLQVPSVRELRDCREYVLGGPHEQRAQRASRVLDLLAAKMMVDEHGQRLLNDAEAVDGCLDDADGEVLEVIRAACSKLAGWNADPDMLAIEDAVKNSEPTPAS